MIHVNVKGVLDAAQFLRSYSSSLEDKCMELCKRLADVGVPIARATYATFPYDGTKDYKITAEPTENGYKVLAEGQTVLFLEFGAGVTYGYGHPKARELGMGPGTWSDGPDGKGHWDDPNGWYLPLSAGKGRGYKSMGNAPTMGMYYAAQNMKDQIETIAREVFANDRR